MHQLAVCESLWKMFCLSTLKMWKKEILDICHSKLRFHDVLLQVGYWYVFSEGTYLRGFKLKEEVNNTDKFRLPLHVSMI